MKDKFKNKTSTIPSIASKSVATQGFLDNPQESDRVIPSPPTKRDFSNLKRLVKHRDTTDCINLIEKFGFYDDAAISVLGFLQQEGVV